MKRILPICLLLTWVSAGSTIPGDLNSDGTVDFDDFFILADNFGRNGPPDTLRVTTYDTLRVTVLDTLELRTVYDTVTVRDTVVINVEYDTVTVVSPIVQEYQTWPDVYEVIDMTDPREGLRNTYVRSGSDRFRLGPDLSFQEHRWVSVEYFEGGQYHEKKYLKPSGHVLTEVAADYHVAEVRQLSDL